MFDSAVFHEATVISPHRPLAESVHRRHVPELDGMRAVAILLVVFSHIYTDFSQISSTGFWNHLLSVWVQATRTGWIGVDVFFVLSGFLITGVLYDAVGKPHYSRNFYMRRILRIFPLYFLTLLVTIFWYHFPWQFLGLSALFCTNLSPYLNVEIVVGPLWSLSLEEQFYLIWPWLVRSFSVPTMKTICILVVVGEPLVRLVAFRAGVSLEYLRFDGMALGALIALVLRTETPRTLKRAGYVQLAAGLLGSILLAPFGIMTRGSIVGTTGIYTMTSLLTGGLICLVLLSPDAGWSAPLRNRALKFIGDTSFFVYLAHWFLLDAWRSLAPRVFSLQDFDMAVARHPWAMYLSETGFVWGLALGLGYLSMHYFEGPLRSLGRHYK